jgi:hypothetical protein
MEFSFEAEREERRRRFLRSLPWLVPAFFIIGPALFFAVGKLVEWLWRVTLVDIFAIKPISFWQAWGLILLSQILFKANMRPTTRTGHWERWRRYRAPVGDSPQAQPGQPPSAGAGMP